MSQPAPVNLKHIIVERILSDDPSGKSVAVLGRYPDKEGQAVVLMSKTHFDMTVTSLQAVADVTACSPQFANDVYHKFLGNGSISCGDINVDIIFPATAKHIAKYAKQSYLMVSESPETYVKLVKPYITNLPPSRLQWVRNILDKKAETERVILEDLDPNVGFLLLPDMKWDQTQTESLYLQAIVLRRDISSVRDLTRHHLPLLENVQRKARNEALRRYKVPAAELRLWLHYQPSYYHLHVHVAHTRWSGPGLHAGKAHLLEDVIENLRGSDTFYSERTMTYCLGENDELYKLLADC